MATKRKALGELSPSVPSTASKMTETDNASTSTKAAALQATPPPLPPKQQQLLIMAASQAIGRFVVMLEGNSSGPSSNNQSLPPVSRPLSDSDLAFSQDLPHGHCKALYTRTRQAGGRAVERVKLKEGGENNDSPRYLYCISSSISSFAELARTDLLGGVTSKVYIYHILAAHLAYTSTRPLAPNLPGQAIGGAPDHPAPMWQQVVHEWGPHRHRLQTTQ
ncbi:MAG: hypothetical protein M1835_005967 [Candelina submexicana]|nr:MAG: hypothetical protein M1835_005967 [Candelina submexicana]